MLRNSRRLCFLAKARLSSPHICHATGLLACARTYVIGGQGQSWCWAGDGKLPVDMLTTHVRAPTLAQSIDQAKFLLSCSGGHDMQQAGCWPEVVLGFDGSGLLACRRRWIVGGKDHLSWWMIVNK